MIPFATYVIEGPVEADECRAFLPGAAELEPDPSLALSSGRRPTCPPEQFRGDTADARHQYVATLVALYEALYGERPFSGSFFAATHSFTKTSNAGPLRSAHHWSSSADKR